MTQLKKSLAAFGHKNFNQILKQELLQLPISHFPLEEYTTQGGIVEAQEIGLSIYPSKDLGQKIEIKLAVFFDETVAGCNCGDPPMKIPNNFEMLLYCNKVTGEISY